MIVQSNIKNILVGLNTIEVEKVRLQGLLKQEYSKIKFKNYDGKMFAIRGCDLIIEEKYQSSQGYSDGYSYESNMFIYCKGELFNRLWFETKYETPYEKRNDFSYNLEEQFKTKYRNLFKSTKVIPTNELQINWVNNSYIDKNPEKFFISGGNSL